MIKTYLINLDKDSERLSFVTSNFKKLGVEFERISAVDGRTFSEQDFQAFSKPRPRRNNKVWMRGQMGCFLSHFAAWEKIAKGDQDFCAVFEDDIHLSDDLTQILNDGSWIPGDADVIRLETSTNRIRLSPQPLVTRATRNFYGVKSTSWCTGGYLISRKAAQQLIDLPVQHHQPSDVILFNFEDSVIAKKLNILQCHPALCTQDKHTATQHLSFASNIELPVAGAVAGPSQFMEKLKRLSPALVVGGLYRSLLGYKRIGFR